MPARRRPYPSSKRRHPLLSAPAPVLSLSLYLCLLLSPQVHAAGRPQAPGSTLYFPQAAARDVNTIFIPFTLVGQLIMVTATTGATTGLFMLDTGSERLVLNQHHFPDADGGRSVTAVGNTGLIHAAVETGVDSLRLEGLTIYDLEAHLVDLSHIEFKKKVRMIGILGQDVFRDFELFIDFQKRALVLMRVDRFGQRLDAAAPWETPYDSLSFDLKKHLIVMDATVNQVRLKMILDSGAELNLIDRRVNRKALDKFTIIKRVNLIGAGKREVEVLAGTLADVECGRQRTAKMNTLLTSLDEINRSLGVNADGVLGYEFLKRRRVLINYQKQMLYFFEFGRA